MTFRPITLTFSHSWPLPCQFPSPTQTPRLGALWVAVLEVWKAPRLTLKLFFALRKRHCRSPWMANCCLSKMDPFFSKTFHQCKTTNSQFSSEQATIFILRSKMRNGPLKQHLAKLYGQHPAVWPECLASGELGQLKLTQGQFICEHIPRVYLNLNN